MICSNGEHDWINQTIIDGTIRSSIIIHRSSMD